MNVAYTFPPMATKKTAKTKAKRTALGTKKKPASSAKRRVTTAAAKARKTAPARRASARAAKPAARPANRTAKRTARPAATKHLSVAKKKPVARKPIRRRDGSGHLNPQYAAELRAKSGRPEAEPSSFLERPRSKDDLVEELGEEVVAEATSAEHEAEDILDQEVPEERGGPFVETTGAEEFAHGIDPSNPKGAKREPFPTT
jgi:hypothetical protein